MKIIGRTQYLEKTDPTYILNKLTRELQKSMDNIIMDSMIKITLFYQMKDQPPSIENINIQDILNQIQNEKELHTSNSSDR